MYLNLEKNIAKAERSTRLTDPWASRTKRLNYGKWRFSYLGVSGLRHSQMVIPSRAMLTLARAISPNMIVLYIFTAIEGDQGNCQSWRVLCEYAHATYTLERATRKPKEGGTGQCS